MPDPTWMTIAEAEIGERQWPGKLWDNPRILEYLAACGFHPQHDEGMAWCGAFATWTVGRAGLALPGDDPGDRMVCAYPPWWRGYGTALESPKRGALAIKRSGLHVAFVHDVDGPTVDLLGGNQDDAVKIWLGRHAADYSYRWPE
jgi:uncharacterized protein (TIGR02594 family)